MRRSHTLSALALATLGLLGSGCVDDSADVSLLILKNSVPDPGCVITGSAAANFIPSGVIDTNADFGYVFTPVVQNFASTEISGTDPQRRVFVEGANVDIRFETPDVFDDAELDELRDGALTRFRVPFSGSIAPNEGTAGFAFEALPLDLLEAIRDKTTDRVLTILDIQIVGTQGGSTVKSQVFHYPVTVCTGCLVVDRGACSGLPDGFVAAQGGACNPAQDAVVDCCTDGAIRVCPATSTAGLTEMSEQAK
jgi:hypothetical protein